MKISKDKSGFNGKTEAVSPVVGVMLMLVVVIIIATVITSFSGGMMDTSHKVSNLGIKATYSQTDGLAVTNLGGDPLETSNIDILIRLPDTFGDYEHMTWTIDHRMITSKRYSVSSNGGAGGDYAWLKNDGSQGVYVFAPGDTAYVKRNEMPAGHDVFDVNNPNRNPYSIQSRYNIGKEFWVEIVDKKGTTLAKTKTTIVK